MGKPISYALPAAGTDCTWPMQAPSFRGTAQACGSWSEARHAAGRSHCGYGRFFGFEHLVRQIPPVVRVRRLQRKSLRHMLGKGRDAPSFGFDLHCPALPLRFSFGYSIPVVQEGRRFLRTGVRGAFLRRFRLRARLRTAARPTCAFILKKRRPPQPFFPKRGALRGRIGGETIFRPFSHKKTRAAGS